MNVHRNYNVPAPHGTYLAEVTQAVEHSSVVSIVSCLFLTSLERENQVFRDSKEDI